MNTINIYYTDCQNLKNFIINKHDILFADNVCSVLVQIFCGNFNKKFLTLLVQQISELVPQAQIIGTTTSGEIMDGAVSGSKTVLSFSVFRHSNIRIVFAPQKKLSSYELGQAVAATLNSKNTKLLILFSTGLSIDSGRMLDGVQSVSPNVPVAGGISGYNQNQSGFVFCKDGITDCGIVGAVLESEVLSANQYWQFGWIPIGKEMTITRAAGPRVYTIDHIPAYQIFKKYLGDDAKSDMVFKLFPLIGYRRGIEIASVPMFVYDDDSMNFSGSMIDGEKVRFSFGNIELIAKAMDQLIEKIREQQVESIFIYSCALRRGYLRDSTEMETLPLQKIASTSGFFTNGEFYHVNGMNQLLQATMTTVTLSESDKLKKVLLHKQTSNTFSSNSSNVIILKALTNLVNTVTKELVERTDELEKVNKETLYDSAHDPLTGIYNRGFYEQEMNRLKACNVSLAIIICDVDGLKLVNDTLGHSAGDALLKAAADILKSSFGDEDLVARIGGDEYSVLLTNVLLPDVKSSIQKIQEAIASYNLSNPSIPLSLSLGYSNCEKSFGNTDTLFKEADDNMYREKLHHRKSIRSGLIQTLIQTLEAKDINTVSHCRRLQDMMLKFSKYIGLSQSQISDLQLFARFHDIGKIGIPDHILFKQGALTPQEKIEIQRHCEIGYRIAHSSADLIPIADWILKHHEWWNGKGYPYGLSGEDIPFECRILAIMDAYDAMINDRPYRKAMNKSAAFQELKRCEGTQFDPLLVEKFIASLKDI